MLTRADILRLAAFGAAGLVLPGVARAGDPPRDAASFIHQAGLDLAAIARGAATAEERRRDVRPFLDRVVDIGAIARFCLGRFWNAATPAQREEYVALFASVLLTKVVDRLGTYSGGGARVTTGRTEQAGEDYAVPTTVRPTDGPPVHVTWRVSFATGAPKIVDVSAEGISLRVTLRSDYTSFLARNGADIGALLAALRRQAAHAS